MLLLAAATLLCVAFFADIYYAPKPNIYQNADFSRIFEDRHGRILRVTLSSDGKYRIFTPLADLPEDMRSLALLYEDRAFYRHPGVNPAALVRALVQTLTSSRRQGGSTITMQVVRLSQKFSTAGVAGKLRQIRAALILERHYSKAEILEAYFNLAPYGANVEGAGAAARVWFHKAARDLNMPEILALTTVPQHPAARNPQAAQTHSLTEARIRLDALRREAAAKADILDDLAANQAKDSAKTSPKTLSTDLADALPDIPLRVFGPSQMPFAAPHAVESLLALPNIPTGRLQTTLDLGLQNLMERVLTRMVNAGKPWGLDNASALLMDWRNGEIMALAGSADYFNASIHGQVDGTMARRSPGSTLKPFIYALALQEGLIHPQSLLTDAPRIFKGYEPENADNVFRGPVSARAALSSSRNIPAVTLASALTAPGLYGFLRRANVRFDKGAEHYGLSLVLGGAEVSMRELAGLYGMLANKGLLREPKLLREAHSNDQAQAPQLLRPEAAFTALQMLRIPSPDGFDRTASYWKTGTSNGLRDAWTAGVFGPYVLVVWAGRFDGAPNPGFTGSHAAAPIFFALRRALEARVPLPDLAADATGLDIVRLNVCTVTGDIDVTLCPNASQQTEIWFIPGLSPIKNSGILRRILVDETSGLRQCRPLPGRTKEVVWEFWPADLRRLFLEAEVRKAPAPPPAPECLTAAEDFEQALQASGMAPIIRSPASGLVYTTHLTKVAGAQSIPLNADIDADAGCVYWFAGTEYLGRSNPDSPLYWTLTPGKTRITAVDDRGRASSAMVQVESAL